MRLGKERGHARQLQAARRCGPSREATDTDGHPRDLKKLPHRYPILLVDRVLELEKGKRIRR
jgi:hypothetical protein